MYRQILNQDELIQTLSNIADIKLKVGYWYRFILLESILTDCIILMRYAYFLNNPSAFNRDSLSMEHFPPQKDR